MRKRPLRVLIITSEFPSPGEPHSVPFLARRVEQLRRSGVDVDVFRFRGGKKLINYVRGWKKLRDRLRRKQYDLLHANFGQSGLLALPKPLPLIVTFRGSDLEGIVGRDGRYTFKGKLLRLASQFVALRADEVVSVSERLARHLPTRNYHVIPAGLDLDLFKPMPKDEARRRLGLPADRFLVFFAADIRKPEKRYWLARDAVERAKAQLTSAGREMEIIAAGNILPNLIPLYMNACDVLLLTSLHEGSPNVVKEALACDLPVIATDVGDVQLRIGEVDGCAVVGDSPDEIAAALERVYRRNDRIDGRRSVMGLDEKLQTQKTIEVYNQAMAKTNGGKTHATVRDKKVLVSFAFHKIGSPRYAGDLYSLPAEHFLRILQKAREQPCAFTRWDQALSDQAGGYRFLVAFTFDDGYESDVTEALPLLQRWSVPATFFIVPSLIGQGGNLTWTQVRELAACGHAIGSHTLTHAWLPELPDKELQKELRDSRLIIEDQIGAGVRLLALPGGFYNHRVLQAAQEAGYSVVGTSRYGVDPLGNEDDREFRVLKRNTIDLRIRWEVISNLLDARPPRSFLLVRYFKHLIARMIGPSRYRELSASARNIEIP